MTNHTALFILQQDAVMIATRLGLEGWGLVHLTFSGAYSVKDTDCLFGMLRITFVSINLPSPHPSFKAVCVNEDRVVDKCGSLNVISSHNLIYKEWHCWKVWFC